MGLAREEEVEIRSAPVFKPGERVVARRLVKNDGTYPRKDIGEPLVMKGDVGYVRDIGTFLQMFWIYAVEWTERGTIVGMRGKELVSMDAEPEEAARYRTDAAARAARDAAHMLGEAAE